MHKVATRRKLRNHYDISGDLEKIKDAFAQTAVDVKGKTGEVITQSFEDLKERSTELYDGVADYTSEKPFTSIGIALLTGLAIGFLINK